MTSHEAKVLSDESKTKCNRAVTIGKLIEIAYQVGDDAENAKKWSTIAIILSALSIILHFA